MPSTYKFQSDDLHAYYTYNIFGIDLIIGMTDSKQSSWTDGIFTSALKSLRKYLNLVDNIPTKLRLS